MIQRWAGSVIVLGLVLCIPLATTAQVRLYAGHSGSGGGEIAPGAFSSVDPATGQVTVIGTANVSGGGVAGLASNGREIFAALAISGAATLVTIDPATGTVGRTIGPIVLSGGGPCSIGDLAMGSDGVLYGFTANGWDHVCDGKLAGTLVTINTKTAVATALGRPMETAYGTGSAGNVNGGLAVDGAGRLWLSPGWNHPQPGRFFELNRTTGLVASTRVLSGVFPDDDGANGLAWNPVDGRLYASFEGNASDPVDRRSLWAINPSTGASQLISDTGYQLHDLVFFSPAPTSAAPLLGTRAFTLMAGLMIVFGLYSLRRRTSH